MTGMEFLEKLLESYESSFDIIRPYDIHENRYDAYAAFNVTSAKYVLVKKAELWRADCFEHTLFSHKDTLTVKDLDRLKKEIISYIEPHLVRGDKKCMDKDHMYTYITTIFICENGLSSEAKKAVYHFRFFKNYQLGLRGYSEARILIFDMENHKVLGNRAAKALVKGYKKAF